MTLEELEKNIIECLSTIEDIESRPPRFYSDFIQHFREAEQEELEKTKAKLEEFYCEWEKVTGKSYLKKNHTKRFNGKNGK